MERAAKMIETKQIDIDTLTGRELDAAVAEVVMGWTSAGGVQYARRGETGFTIVLPEFSTDERYAAQVEAEIERRGWTYMYIYWLERDVSEMYEHDDMDNGDWFKIVNATPEQRCRAAYRAVMSGI